MLENPTSCRLNALSVTKAPSSSDQHHPTTPLQESLNAVSEQSPHKELLVCFQKGDPARVAPIVYTYGGHGMSEGRQTVRHFGTDQPMYAMQAPELVGMRFETLAQRVKHHADVLQNKFPQIGLHLVGNCFGGIIAHGVARVFEEEGRPYTLTLIDPVPNLPAAPDQQRVGKNRMS